MPSLIGNKPNQVPTNGDLGTLAFQDADNVKVGSVSATSLTDSGNLTFTGTGNRITGDFTNATIANRVIFQSSTTNGAAYIGAMGNGTSARADFMAFGTGSDVNNSPFMAIQSRAGAGLNILESGITGTGTYYPLAMYTGGSERLRIDTSGNVGIGTSSPTQRLTLSVADGGGISLGDRATAGTFLIGRTGGGALTGNTTSIGFQQVGSTGGNITYQAHSDGSGGNHIFSTANAERMRINSNGIVQTQSTLDVNRGANTTTPLNVGAVIRYAGAGSQYGLQFIPTANNTVAVYFSNAAGTGVGQIETTATTTTYVTSSDYRLKENITPMTGALEKVNQLKPVTYKWKVDGSDGQGFIAHELQAVVPDCVSGEKDAVDAEGNPKYQGIDTSFLVATLTAAIQELKAELDATKAEVAALKAAA